jgi:diguanylate cyclase (GGDEF)-like protein/PAS domain S-box-containing protein
MTAAPATILIVDDESQSRKLLEALLRPEGYLTRIAASGEEALASIAEFAPDLILLDIMMPGMDGFQVATALKSNLVTSNIPIIMVTTNIDRNARLAGLNAGAEDFLTKPVDRAELWLRVRNLLRLKEYGDFLQNHSSILNQQVQDRTTDLRASELQFRQMAENIRDIFYLVDAKSNRVLYVSPAYEEISGYTCENLLADNEPWTAAIHPEDRLAAETKIRSSMSSGGFELEYRMLRPDGAIRWIESRGFPVRDAAGRLVRVAGVAKDITERKLAAQDLLASEQRMSDMLGNVELASVMLDPDGNITYCNDYLLRLTDWEREEVLGKDWFEIFLAPDEDNSRGFYEALLANRPEAWHRENQILTRDGGRRLMRWNNTVLRSGAGEIIGTASIGEDITESKAAEARIVRLNRVYAVLSAINMLIVRSHDRDKLYREACQIAVDAGAFKMAWIGVLDPESLDGKIAAWYGGEEGYVDQISFTARADTPDSERPTSRVLRQGQPVICNDVAHDADVGPLREEILRRGHKSFGCFPLIVGGRTEGVLSLFSGEANVFDEEETRLVLELAGDISFAMDHIGKEEKLNYFAYYDALTGLANRNLFLERVSAYMRSATSGSHKLALYLIDLERFKNINDSLGKPAGDALLKQVGEWLTRNCGGANLVARVGADLFAVVLPEVRPQGNLSGLMGKFVAAFLEHPFRLDDSVFRLAAKAGIAVFPDDGKDAETLFRHVEAALKKAKSAGERFLFYTQDMTERVAARLTLENQLRQALDNDEFVLHYQPKVNLNTGMVTGAEALIRWNDPRTGLVPPGRFIPILEETGLVFEVGRWALRKAVADYLHWRKSGLARVRIAVNVSPLQLRNRDFVAEIQRKIGIDPDAAAGLELEITESLIMEDVKHNIASLKAIREMGVRIAIDDFGTGFSSLAYLAKLPVDALKIDRTFVTDMTASPEGLALVSTIISLAHSLRLNVVAEGVETQEQSRLLRLLDCDEMQGYLFSKPVPREVFEERFLTLNELSRAPGPDGPEAPAPVNGGALAS